MAFYCKAGGVLRQSRSSARNVQSSMSSMLMSVRCITSKLYIKGISDQADDQSLRKAFSSYGDVIEAKVVCERGPLGKSRGFAFVTFNNLDSAASAMSSMDDQELLGQKIRVYYAYGRQGPRTYGGSTLFGGVDCGYNLENPKY